MPCGTDAQGTHGLIANGAGRTLPFSKLRWITLVGGGQQEFEGWGNPDNMRHFLNGSIAGYGGVKDAEIEFIYNTIGPEEGLMHRHTTPR
ncbi:MULTISPECIES: hypothetical protein [unclassified Janthinobacterium]|uniref:hypothetical protein n=1 Tax=unclassified Janthinobacterium TaxID=2610881 RepID=UPI00161FEC46|nr:MULTISPECIES: hypothetical protein [unclassified Janthinobacterium]MBB5609591.1 putative NADPH-quinone reductase [Janthinobacterium sp. S3T4]MBB5614763.1 putative NADPH-quinone reductase [Janthinobacterium sp. S3M3]